MTVVAGGLKFTRVFDSAHGGVELSIVETGDTAAIVAMTVESEMDSFPYMDTFVVDGKTDSVPVTWLSPVMVAYITPGAVDTTATLACSVSYASTDIPGFEYAIPEDTVMANMIDDLVDSLEAIAGIDDSVTVEDSVTYIKLIAKFSTDTHGGRWSLVYDGDLDTSYTRTTVAMWCDSFITAVNASDAADYVTASDSTDSIYIISDDAGLDFAIYLGDSTVATDTTQLNVTSQCEQQDTLGLGPLVYRDISPNVILSKFILLPSHVTAQGAGLSDSGYLWLYTTFDNQFFLLDSAVRNALPCTLYYAAKPGTDTLYKEDLTLVYRVTDTASDTTMTLPYKITADWLIRD